MLLLVLRKNLFLHFSSKYLLAYEFLSFVFNCSIFVGVSVFISKERSMEYAGYVLPGLGAMEMMTAALVAPKSFIDTEIGSGTLEYILLSTRSLNRLMVVESILLLLRSILLCFLYLVIGKVLTHGPSLQPNPIVFLAAVALVIQFWSLGLVSAGLTLATRRGNGFNTLILIAACLIGGVYFPLDSLPRVIRWMGATNTLNALTRALRNDLPWNGLLIPALTSLLSVGFGLWIFYSFLRWARREGRLYL